MTLTAALCPPHHWWIEELTGGWQRWECYRCGFERKQEVTPVAERPFAVWTPRSRREEEASTMS